MHDSIAASDKTPMSTGRSFPNLLGTIGSVAAGGWQSFANHRYSEAIHTFDGSAISMERSGKLAADTAIASGLSNTETKAAPQTQEGSTVLVIWQKHLKSAMRTDRYC